MNTERSLDQIRADLGPLADRPGLAISLAELGQPGSRYRITTPAAVVDLDALDRNLARQAERARQAGLAIRPHAKSHKTSAIALRQMALGASGICCAKLAEAEALMARGAGPVLITSPVAGPDKAARAAALAARDLGFAMTVDHLDGVAEIGNAARSIGTRVRLVIDVDVGLGRTGVSSLDQARQVAEAIAADDNLDLVGIQGYGGQWQHMAGANARAAAVWEGMKTLAAVATALRAEGHAINLITGGGTGSFSADANQQVLTEVQPGSYAFMDRQYREALADDEDGAFETSFFIQARVISANAPAWVTVDAGLKAFATDGGMPEPSGEAWAGAKFRFFGDEHGMLTRPEGRVVARGDRVELTAPHCDPTVDRHEVLHLVRGDVLVDIVPVEARGASQ